MPRSSKTGATRRRARPLRRAGGARRREAAAVGDPSPSLYIARVDKRTGAEIDGPIDPDELLVHAHRDHHPVEVGAQFVASRLIQLTGREQAVDAGIRRVNAVGGKLAEMVATVAGRPDLESRAKRLLGVMGRGAYFKYREPTHLSEKQVRSRVERLQRDAAAAFRARGRSPRLKVLLTGATGFVGKEILAQAAGNRRIEEVVAVVRPETVRDPKTKEVVKVLAP